LLRALKERLAEHAAVYTYVLDKNEKVLVLLTGRAGLPAFQREDRIHHFGFFVGLPVRCCSGYRITEVTPAAEEEWNAHLLQWSRERNLAPNSWVSPVEGERRFLVLRGKRPVALGSLLDQTPARRFIPTQMSLRDQALRWALNGLAAVTQSPPVPGQGQLFRQVYVANMAYDVRYAEAIEVLLAHCQSVLKKDGVPFFYIGLSERDPVFSRLNRRWGVHHFCTLLFTAGLSPCHRQPTFVNLHEM
jgi:hypothetical protein